MQGMQILVAALMPAMLEAWIVMTEALLLTWKGQTLLSSNWLTYNTEVRFTAAVCRTLACSFRKAPDSSRSSWRDGLKFGTTEIHT